MLLALAQGKLNIHCVKNDRPNCKKDKDDRGRDVVVFALASTMSAAEVTNPDPHLHVPGPVWDAAAIGEDVEETYKNFDNAPIAALSSETSDEDRYMYAPLNTEWRHVRLLRVLSRGGNQAISCSLSIYRLKHAPKYHALSYAWSRPDSDCSIWIDGKRLEVGKNLLRFLSMAISCKRYKQALFWIDAVCIGQSSTDERSDQVAFMASIYKQAQSVIAWLGPAYGESTVAMKALRNTPSLAEMPRVWNSSAAGIRRLCYRRYWTRLWVLQELALAKSVILHCGQDHMAGWKLAKFLSVLKSCSLPDCVDRIGLEFDAQNCLESPAWSMISQVWNVSTRKSLYRQVCQAKTLQCREPRDGIFALLGITQTSAVRIRPDYNAPLVHIVMDVIRHEHILNEQGDRAASPRQIMEICDALGVSIKSVMLESYETEQVAQLGITSQELQRNQLSLEEGPVSSITDAIIGLLWGKLYDWPAFSQFWLSNTPRRDQYALIHQACIEQNPVVFKLLFNIVVANEGVPLSPLGPNHPFKGALEARTRHAGRYPAMIGKLSNCTHEKLVFIDMLEIRRLHWKSGSHGRDPVPYTNHVRSLFDYLDSNTASSVIAIDDYQVITRWQFEDTGSDILKALYHSDVIDVNERGFWGRTVLHQAVKRNRLDQLRLLRTVPNLQWNAQDSAGQAPLHLALHIPVVDVFKIFTTVPAVDWNIQDNQGRTPLHIVQRKKNPFQLEFFQKLLTLDWNIQDHEGKTPWHVAIAHLNTYCLYNLQTVSSVKWTTRDSDGCTALQIATAALYGRIKSLHNVDEASRYTMRYLREISEIDVNAKTYDGDTALHILVSQLKSGMGLNEIVPQGKESAASHSFREVFEFLCGWEDLDLNVHNDRARTPLCEVVPEAGTPAGTAAIDLLIRHGAHC